MYGLAVSDVLIGHAAISLEAAVLSAKQRTTALLFLLEVLKNGHD